MDFDWLQLTAILGAATLVNVWMRVRLRVPSAAGSPRRKTPWLSSTTLLACLLAVWALLTIPSEDGFLLAVLATPIQLILLAVAFFRYNRWRGKPVPWHRLVFGNLLVLTVPLPSALAAGELWYRFVHDTTDSIGYTKVARRWLTRHYRFNNVGYRDDVDYDLGTIRADHRITFVGDSFTAGHGIVDVNARTANLLRRDNPSWEVHVLAKNGRDTAAEIKDLKLAAALGYAFDEVVLVYCLNDVMDLLPHWQETLAAAAKEAEGRLALFDSSYLLDTLYYRVVIAQLPGVGDYFSFIGEAYRGELWQRQQERLQTLAQLVERSGGRLSVVTWPFLHGIGPDYAHADIHRRLDEFWRSQGIAHLDLLPLLREHRPEELVVNAADAHPNERASKLAAAAIQPWLRRIIAMPRDRNKNVPKKRD
ncbi:MAG TPA: SGNH/GDSL hydrolase family protein [bacterium]|nr:SGNH/GDSL hydrolase family protein [bacterium]